MNSANARNWGLNVARDDRKHTLWGLPEYSSRKARKIRASTLLAMASTLRSGSARVWSGVRPEALGFSLEAVVLTKTISLGAH
jgi:hypothetical protein